MKNQKQNKTKQMAIKKEEKNNTNKTKIFMRDVGTWLILQKLGPSYF